MQAHPPARAVRLGPAAQEMNRHYNVAQYMDLIRYAKEKKIPGVTFSSDIIVGFPGETEEDFAATLDLIRKVGYMQLFTFIYSSAPAPRRQSCPTQRPTLRRPPAWTAC